MPTTSSEAPAGRGGARGKGPAAALLAALRSPAPFGPGARAALLAAFALLCVLRLPVAWTHGRFLGEEGVVFFAYGWHRPVAEALGRPFAGYLNLGADAAGLLAARLVRGGVLPLEQAPHLTMALATLVQLVPAWLLLAGRAPWLRERWAVLASLFVLAASPRTEEVFANILHIQFHLALAAALILALDVPRTARGRLGEGLVLFLAPLCGPGAIVVLPLFGLRALVDREAGRWAQLGVFAAGTAVQLLLFFGGSPVRGQLLGPPTVAAILFVRLMLLPLFTSVVANHVGHLVQVSRAAGGVGWWLAAAGGVAWFGWLLRAAARRRDGVAWLLGAALLVALVSFGGGMIAADPREWFNAGAGERYNYLPQVLVGLALVGLAVRPGRRGLAPLLLVALVLLVGAATLFRPLGELSSGPSWPAEVAAWRLDHDHPLATWPADWQVDLSDRDRPCAPGRRGAAPAAGEPSYCEGAWVVRIQDKLARRAREQGY